MNTLSLGEKLKLLRKKTGMTQRELADKIPISFSTFRRWEKNEHAPDYKFLKKLAEILGTSVAYLSGEINSSIPVNIDISRHENNYNTRELPNMSYWGGVADNARNVAKYGNEADKADVCQMLKRALSALIQTTESPTNVDIHHNDMSKASFNF